MDIRSLPLKDAAKMLRLPAKVILAHIHRGLPKKDGRIDLVVYAAWMNLQEKKRQHHGT